MTTSHQTLHDIFAACRVAGISLNQLAARAGVDRSQVARWVNRPGVRGPHERSLWRLVEALGSLIEEKAALHG